jgi:hypothetical protein
MRQPKAAGRSLVNARRVVLTSLGASLVVGAAAPIASAATIADTALPAAAPIADTAPASDNASMANAVPISHAAVLPAAAPVPDTANLTDTALPASESALAGATSAGWARLGQFKLYPLAGTGIDPLSNVVGTSIGGIPVSTQPVSAMVSDGLPVSDLPVVGGLFGAPQQ